MAKQTRLATTLTARYFPTAELTDAFYMDGRVTSKTTARSADLTNDKEDRGFFFSVFSHQTNPDYDPNTLPPYEPVLRRLGTELKSGRRSLDDQIGEMVNTAVSITGRMKIQQDNNRAPFFAGVMVKDAEAFAITIGKGLAFLYRDDTLYPMTATDIRIDAINTQRQKVDNFYNFCATKTAPALCSNIAQLKLDDCIILCNREVYEALGQQELLRILYDAEDQSDAASVVITEAAAKLPGVPLQFMISFVEDITSSDRGGFFGFGRKKKKEVEVEEDYDISAPIPLDSPKPAEPAAVPKDAMLFGDEKAPEKSAAESVAKDAVKAADTAVTGAGAAAGAVAAGAAVAGTVAAGAAAEKAAEGAAAAKTAADSVSAAINTPIPEPPLSFGDVSDLMKTDATSAKPAETEKTAEVKEEADLEATKVVPFVNSFDKAAAELDAATAPKAAETAVSDSPFVQPKEVPAEPKPAEPFVAVKNDENPFFKAAVQAQKMEDAPSSREDNVSFDLGADEDKKDDGAPLLIGDDLFGDAPKSDAAKAEQVSDASAEKKEETGSAAETDEDAPLVFEADREVKSPVKDESDLSNDPKEFDETPLFFGDAEPSAEEKYETHEAYPSDYEQKPQEEIPESSDDFVIPFASSDMPANASGSADDIPEMPIYEAPTYTPPTYPTNSDTPVGYEETGVYARGSYTVDEDEAAPSISPFVDATPVSPFVTGSQPSFGESASSEMELPQQDEGMYAQPEAIPEYEAPEEGFAATPAEDYPSFVEAAEPHYDVNNPPPAVADLFDMDTPSAYDPDSASITAAPAAAPSAVPPYMQQSAVRPGSVPGVSRRPQGSPSRPGGRPNAQPARRRMDAIDDGFDSGDGQGTSYLPYVLAAVSVICLIIIIALIAKSCGDSKSKKKTKDTDDTNITDVSGDITDDSTETTPETTPAVTTPDPVSSTDPIGVYTFSDKTGCRTWWDLFYNVYGIKIDSETDARVTTILTYNGLDTSYVPKAGETIKLPPAAMIQA
ncbi:MAG: hypothetical protein J6Y08_03130 [Clostridiales bacterium]|nr:hypothetical protein [Clostridiales bacterium]